MYVCVPVCLLPRPQLGQENSHLNYKTLFLITWNTQSDGENRDN